MQEAVAARTPVHLWIVGVLALIWNGFGAFNYVMTRTRNSDYVASMTPGTNPDDVFAYIDSFPIWAQFGWGLGVWGGVIGAVLLLMRNRWATLAFGLSLVGAILGLGYQIANPGGPAEMHEGAGGIIPYVIIAVAAALLAYAWNMRKKGILH